MIWWCSEPLGYFKSMCQRNLFAAASLFTAAVVQSDLTPSSQLCFEKNTAMPGRCKSCTLTKSNYDQDLCYFGVTGGWSYESNKIGKKCVTKANKTQNKMFILVKCQFVWWISNYLALFKLILMHINLELIHCLEGEKKVSCRISVENY